MTPFQRELRTIIEAEGPLPISRYMMLCLGHPVYGYYATRDPFGAAGDFVTAPEVSQMFGELIGLWCVETWHRLAAPASLDLVELGPGRGTLMADLLRAAAVDSKFRDAIAVHLVETSPLLTARQRETLRTISPAPTWHRGVETLPDRAGPVLVIANEFIDALPIDQFVKTEDGWHERRIGLEGDRLAFGLDPASIPDFERRLPDRLRNGPPGAVWEQRDLAVVHAVARRIRSNGGVALFIDYGHVEAAFGDTLQAVRAHSFADPLDSPGEADLTAQVDFDTLIREIAAEGIAAFGPLTQGEFLRRLGIDMRAARLKRAKDPSTSDAIDAAVARLAGPKPGMGELFKAVAFAHPSVRELPAFGAALRSASC